MSKIKFQIGSSNHVKISLPSKMYGDGETFVGRAKVQVYGLSCSEKISIWKPELDSFFKQLEKAYRTLKGKFVLESKGSGFKLDGEMTAKGKARIGVKMGHPVRNHPDYNEYYVETAFLCDPELFKEALNARDSQ